MVLVSDKPSNDIGSLQTKLGNRQGHETRRVGLEAMPLDQDIEGSHGEREPGVEIRPDDYQTAFSPRPPDGACGAMLATNSFSLDTNSYEG